MSLLRTTALLAATSLLALGRTFPAEASEGYIVVVNEANPLARLSRPELAKLFLKRATTWPGGAAAMPFDLSGVSPVRKAFTQAVHGKPLWVIVAFWEQEIASGRSQPPVVCATEEAALQAVRDHPGGVAYVSANVPLVPGVKSLVIAP